MNNFLMVANWFPSSNNQAKGIFFFNHASALWESGKYSSVTVFCFSSSISDFLEDNLFQVNRYNGVLVIRLTLPLGKYIQSQHINFFITFVFAFCFTLYCLFIKQSAPRFLAQNIGGSSYACSLIAKIFNLKCNTVEHSTGLIPFNGRFNYWLTKTIRHSSLHVVSANYGRKFFQLYGVQPKITINCLSPMWPKPDQLPLSSNIKRFIFVGHLIPRKNILSLIDAFKHIDDQAATLHVVGNGPLIKNVIQAVKTDKRISFEKSVNNCDLKTMFAPGTAMVLPSLEETFGVVLIEAASQGCFLISSRCGGPEEIIDKLGQGLVLNDVSTKGIYAALKDSLSYTYNPSLIADNAIAFFSGSTFATSIN